MREPITVINKTCSIQSLFNESYLARNENV
jgi:hypothetical protein